MAETHVNLDSTISNSIDSDNVELDQSPGLNVIHELTTIVRNSDTTNSVQESSTRTKSSSEILSELFSSFNAEFQDPTSSTLAVIDPSSPEESQDIEDEVHLKRKKSSKKKHKHKTKKQKKKEKKEKTSLGKPRRSSKTRTKSTHNQSPVENILTEHEPSEPIGICVKISNLGNGERSTEMRHSDVPVPYPDEDIDQSVHGRCKEQTIELDRPPLELKAGVPTVSSEHSSISKETSRSATSNNKISIKNLKFSSVFEATLREVEEQAKAKQKAKAEKYEEGELSNSSEGDISPKYSHASEEDTSLSPSPRPAAHIPSSSDKKRCKRHRSKSSDHRSHLEHNSSTKRSKESKKDGRSKHSSTSSHRHKERHQERTKTRSRSKDCERQSRKYESSNKPRFRDRSTEDRKKLRDDDLRLSIKNRNGSRRSSRDERYRKKRSGRSYSKSPSFDKQKLMEIARRNALNLLKQGALPGSLGQDKMVTIKAGGKSVEELTNFCKRLSKKETGKSGSEDDEGDENNTDSETERPFNHPFQIKERPLSIVMNIRNSVQLPVKSLQEKAAEQSKTLRVQFPVSSGQQHRKTENEWVPVDPKPAKSTEQPGQLPTSTTEPKNATPPHVFPSPPSGPVKDIGNIVTQRLRAMRKLQENPYDVQALSAMNSANQDMQSWAESKQLPGQFTGSTGVRVLSVAELSSGTQAYVRKDQLVTATPVSGGMGMSLLQKMGWRPGEGLGKNKGGSLEPLSLEIKMDKKGLVTQEDLKQYPNVTSTTSKPVIRKLSEKHPVSVLLEYCARRHWCSPHFDMSHESGPDHKKNFLFKVQVNGVDYQPMVTSPNKKLAKAEAATVCLRALGVFSS